MPHSHVIVWTGSYAGPTFFHGQFTPEQADQLFQAKPMEQYPQHNQGQNTNFQTALQAFQVLDQFSLLGYTVMGMSGNGACQTSWVLGKQI